MSIAIYTLTSRLHDEAAVDKETRRFLDSLQIDYTLKGADFADYGTSPLSLIYVRTGGTEGIFRDLLPQLREQGSTPFLLLTSGKSNSLAASMEILSYLRQQGLKGEIIHGDAAYIAQRINLFKAICEAHDKLSHCRLGVIGKPSDWLIASQPDEDEIRRRMGISLVHVKMDELIDEVRSLPIKEVVGQESESLPRHICEALPGARNIYSALKTIIARHSLDGFTIRCFDLLTAVHNTGCFALATLNAEGITAGCEGDIPAMLSMHIARALTGETGFQANPSTIDIATGTLLFAHCTIPLNMVERYEYDTHFESGIGVGIRGFMKEGPVTIFKTDGSLSRWFVAEGSLIRNQQEPMLCRTQQIIRLDHPEEAAYFLNNPIGNHHIIIRGHHKQLLDSMMAFKD